MKRHLIIGMGSLLMVGFSGCGEKNPTDLPPPAPASPPPAADVTAVNQNGLSAPPPGSPDQAPPPSGTGAAIPAADSGAPTDMFKGMAQRDIDEFKANATPETHDMNLTPLTEAVIGFHAEYNRYPNNLEELVKARYLARVPFAPKGKKYVIDAKTGEISVQ